jgi:RNA polymerase sigma-70 factor, ECF subfamily
MHDGQDAARRAVEATARQGYGKLVAYLAARTRDLAAAEDALADAFATALAAWPDAGVPASPEAWLLTVARRKVIDAARRRRTRGDSVETLQLLAEESDAGEGRDIPDHRLGLMFACAHPAIEPAVRAPLMLQAVLGFDAAAIAAAFLTAPAAMSQRLVRAKKKIRDAGIPFRVPVRDELADRLETVLDAIYAVYSEAWAEPADAGQPRALAGEAIWLGRLLVSLLPDEPEALGLLALMLHAEARRDARRDAAGAYVALADQDFSRWNAAMIDEAESLLHRAGDMRRIGRYQLEAAVQSAHATRRHTGRTDWPAILELYDALLALTASPVIALNRAVALAEVQGPAAALAALDAIAPDGRLTSYQPWWAARAALLARTGARAAAVSAYETAIALEEDEAVRRFLDRARRALFPSPRAGEGQDGG